MMIKIKGRKYKADLLFLGNKDRKKLRSLFIIWKRLFVGLRNFNSRGVTIPEGISESAFALVMQCPRIIKVYGAKCSFDNFDLKGNKRLQIKATSVDNDLTSFGPNSVWDELYWLDFYRKGKLDGSFDVYKIPNRVIYNFKVNATQTFRQQQKNKRRPRLRMRYDIIIPKKIKPVCRCRI